MINPPAAGFKFTYKLNYLIDLVYIYIYIYIY